MTKLRTAVATDEDDIERNVAIVTEKLRTRGVLVLEDDSPADIASILEGVERFEEAVRLSGGDLMMDEPPPGGRPQPDEQRFMLPPRKSDESAAAYVVRLAEAARGARDKRPT
jgi:hypothetical protein